VVFLIEIIDWGIGVVVYTITPIDVCNING